MGWLSLPTGRGGLGDALITNFLSLFYGFFIPDEVDYKQPIVVADSMVALIILGVVSLIGSSFLIYCSVQFCRGCPSRGRRSRVTPLPDDSRYLNEKTGIHRLAIAGLGLAFTATAYSQSGAPPNPNGPAMVGPLKPAAPRIFDAGPLGNLEINGAFSGFGLWQGHPSVDDKAARADLSNAQIIIQRPRGLIQYYLQAGVYNLPALGTFSLSTDKTIGTFLGPLPEAYLKLAFRNTFSVLAGKLPTLIGAEDTFTFENLNIERGLLWNQENAVNRGVQVNYSKGRYSGSLAWSDGFYSNRYNWISGALTESINAATSVEFTAGGNLGRTGYSNLATPLYQNNSAIYDLIYTHTGARWMVQPYLQYTRVPRDIHIGVGRATSTFGAALLGDYTFGPCLSLAWRMEYIDSSGSARDSSANLLYGPGSDAWSATFTPTYQDKEFFARGETAVVHATHILAGQAFGAKGNELTQWRGALEIGLMF